MQTSEAATTNMASKEYSIERLNSERLPHLEQLHQAVHGRPSPEGYYFKKYNTAYTGLRDVGYIAYNRSGEPVAYYGVLPCFIKYGDRTVLAAQSADTMTHPQDRYKGMFMELSNLTFELCRQLGIQLVFGFPNQNSYHGAIKLGWKMTESMNAFVVSVDGFHVSSLANKFPILKNLNSVYRHKVLDKAGMKVPGVANSVIANGFGGVWRSDEYLRYKSYSKTWVIQLEGAKIWLSEKSTVMIGDMENVDDNNFGPVMRQLKILAKKVRFKQIQFHASPGTQLHQLFLSNFEASTSFPVLFQDFGSLIPLEKIKFTFADIDIF
jgi:hypothetical protein